MPNKKPVTRDWTKETLVIEMENSYGEKFHFEIQPDDKTKTIVRKTDSPDTTKKETRILTLTIPL